MEKMTERIQIYISPGFKEQLRKQAIVRHMSLSTYVRAALYEYSKVAEEIDKEARGVEFESEESNLKPGESNRSRIGVDSTPLDHITEAIGAAKLTIKGNGNGATIGQKVKILQRHMHKPTDAPNLSEESNQS
jgi:hypothetical protein